MNRKLELDVDALAVASFEVANAADAGGTAQAHGPKQRCAWSFIPSCPGTVHMCASYDLACREGV